MARYSSWLMAQTKKPARCRLSSPVQSMRQPSAAAIGLVEQAAGSEMLLLDPVPAAEDVFHRQQPYFRKIGLVFGGDGRVTHPVAVLGEDVLTFGRVEEIEIGLGQIARAMLIGDL